jgi:hypothetical protein
LTFYSKILLTAQKAKIFVVPDVTEGIRKRNKYYDTKKRNSVLFASCELDHGIVAGFDRKPRGCVLSVTLCASTISEND